MIERKSSVWTENITFGSHLKFNEQMIKNDLERRQIKREEEYKGENKLPEIDDSLKVSVPKKSF